MFHDLDIILLQVKRVSLLIELGLILIGQGVQPLASPRDDEVGTLPVRPQLFMILVSRALSYAL